MAKTPTTKTAADEGDQAEGNLGRLAVKKARRHAMREAGEPVTKAGREAAAAQAAHREAMSARRKG